MGDQHPHDPQLPALTDYERRVVDEIALWRTSQPDFFERFLSWSGSLVAQAVDSIAPGVVRDFGKRVLEWGLGVVNQGASWTFSERDVLDDVGKAVGITDRPFELDHARHVPLELLDEIAHSYLGENHLITTLEGFGTGLGGFSMMVADIPLVFGANFRVLQQMGTAYGFKMTSADEYPFLLAVLNYSAMDFQDKVKAAQFVRWSVRYLESAAGLSAGEAAAKYVARGLVEHAGRTAAKKEVAPITVRFVEEVAEKLGANLARRGMTKLLPVLGGALSAGFNYWFMRENTGNGLQFFRRRYLEQKYGLDAVAALLGEEPPDDVVIIEASDLPPMPGKGTQ